MSELPEAEAKLLTSFIKLNSVRAKRLVESVCSVAKNLT